MHTLATIYTRKQMNELVCKLTAKDGLARIDPNYQEVRNKEGMKILSAISQTGAKWSVMVTDEVAKEHNLPLWKNIPI